MTVGIFTMRKIKEHFEGLFSLWDIVLPEEALDSRDRGRVAQVCRDGWTVWYRFGTRDGVVHLDFYGSHRLVCDIHERVWEDGRVEVLPTPEDGCLVTGDAEADRRRSAAQRRHNREVAVLLQEKGFILTGEESLTLWARWLSRLDKKADADVLGGLFGEGVGVLSAEPAGAGMKVGAR